MASESNPGTAKYIVLCLGLLIGFVVGFVMLLSSLPINDGLDGYDVYASKPAVQQEQSFDFYKYLPGVSRRAYREPAADQQPLPAEVAQPQLQLVQAPATHIVPANAQIVAPGYHSVPQTAAAQPGVPANARYAEVAANYSVTQSYFLQVGRYGVHDDAQAMRAQVLMLGLEAFIVARVEADGSTAHRVRVGPYFDQNLLTEAKKRLRRGGINYEIVRVTG